MKSKPIYQWILRDWQETCFPKFEITSTYHATENDLLNYYPYIKECRSVIRKYNPSKITDEHLILVIQQNQFENQKEWNLDEELEKLE